MAFYSNDDLPWDASELKGSVTILNSFKCSSLVYHILEISLDDGSFSGQVCCTMSYSKDEFPLIVEEMRSLFKLPKRGMHSAFVNRRRAILYYVPLTIKGDPVCETLLSMIGKDDPLRKDDLFRYNVQKCLAFCDVLSLANTKEGSISLRQGQNMLLAINSNQNKHVTPLVDSNSTILPKIVYNKWFGEHTSMGDVLKSMVNYRLFSRDPYSDNILNITSEIRDKMEEIINRRDKSYIWYINMVLDRLSRSLLG